MLIMTKHFNLQWFGTDIIYEFPCYHDSDLRKKKSHSQFRQQINYIKSQRYYYIITIIYHFLFFFFCISKSLDNRPTAWKHNITTTSLLCKKVEKKNESESQPVAWLETYLLAKVETQRITTSFIGYWLSRKSFIFLATKKSVKGKKSWLFSSRVPSVHKAKQ